MSEVVYTLPPVVELGTLLDCYRDDPVMTHQKWVQWAADCAERALPLFEARHPNDARPRQALDAARAWVAHPTVETRNAAYAAAAAAAYAAAAYAAADAATNAADAATNAAYAAAYAAADAAAYAADAAAYAAYGAAYAAADAAEKQWQAIRLMAIYHGDEA